jgi:hypothetical protein
MAVDQDPVFYPVSTDTATDTPMTPDEVKAANSAAAIIEGSLQMWGLGGLGAWAWERALAGDSPEEIYLKLRDPSTYAGKIYAQRFPAMDALSKEGRAITEGQYIQYENAVANLSARYGIPDGVYNSRDGIAKLMINDLSPVEIEANMRRAAGVVYGQPEVRAAFAQFYGAQGDGAAIAYFLDPDATQPILEQQYAAAQIAGNALAQGLNVGKADAERIALATGATEGQAQQAATIAGSQRELFANLLGESGQVTAAQGIGAALGASAEDVAAVEERRSSRRAQYQGGGSVATSNTGVSGLASANS